MQETQSNLLAIFQIQPFNHTGEMLTHLSLNITTMNTELINHKNFMLDPDFIPNPRKDYENLPEPHRTELLRLYDERTKNFDALAEERKRSFE